MLDYGIKLIGLLKKLGLVLLLFTLSSLFFFIFNYSLFNGISFLEIARICVIGIRFDISVIIYFNILIILAHTIPIGKLFYNKYFQKTISFIYISVNTILIGINLGDSVFYHFTQKRSTIDVIKFIFISDDALKLIPKFAIDYWYVPLFAILIGIIFYLPYYFFRRKIHQKPILNIKLFAVQFLLMLSILGLSLLGARGGLQLRPLSIMHATKYTTAKLVPLILNTPFTLMTTYGHTNARDLKYFDEETASKFYNINKTPEVNNVFKNKNVVIILLESFSKEYVGSLSNYKGYTPFLDSLIGKSLVFTNAFSSGYRSMDAIPSVVTSIPCLIDDPIITSVYANNKYTSLAEILKKKSYSTAFFHGGTNGTLGLDGFVSFLGFEKYYGRSEYNDDKDFDNYWGIYDEPFLQFMIDEIENLQQPFFAMGFTLSSHYPYSLPEKYKNKFKEGPLRIHRVVRYTDYALANFFKIASKKEWFKNTVFIISADHPAQSVIPTDSENIEEKGNLPEKDILKYYKNTSGRYSIPILFYVPADSTMLGKYENTFMQSDIMPSLLDYLDYDNKYIAFGNSAFDSTTVNAAFHYVNGLYQITKGDYCLLYDGSNSTALYEKNDLNHTNNLIKENPEVVIELENILKAYIQEYSQRMRNNNLKAEASF
ncbi:MAG: hypothetical protein C0598_02010 [Marinilabiliales bacterium]|nr:MAG: hypothetical protein C0598_02010 [Marinilabiliales bacterium]